MDLSKKRILFVSGDGGSATVQVMLAAELHNRGYEVVFTSEEGGAARAVFLKSPLKEYVVPVEQIGDVRTYTLVSIGLDVNVHALCARVAHEAQRHHVPTFFPADNYFNHAFPVWRNIRFGHFGAMDEGHQDAILRTRKGASIDVRVTGHPFFDMLPALLKDRPSLRESGRKIIGITGVERVVLWWSHSVKELFIEDMQLVLEGIKQFSEASGEPLVFLPRLHPALDTNFAPGYGETVMEEIHRYFSGTLVRVFDTRKTSLNADELNALSNIVCAASLSIEGFKAALLQIPVIRTFGPSGMHHFTEVLSQTYPFWGDAATGLSFAPQNAQGVCDALKTALDPLWQSQRSYPLIADGGVARQIADFMEEIML